MQNFNIMNYFTLKNVNVCNTARSKETNAPVQCEKFFEINFKEYVTKGMIYNLVNKQKGY